MISEIVKRDGRVVPFDPEKIFSAISRAMAAEGRADPPRARELTDAAVSALADKYAVRRPTVEEIQDEVELALLHGGLDIVAASYVVFRAERTREREKRSRLMRVFDEITSKPARESDIKRDNANVDADTPMGIMLKYGSEAAKEYNEKYLLPPDIARAHREGDIHIHDFEFYALTLTCCQIDLTRLFAGGFSTGHGYLREPGGIRSYAALACIAIQSNQNDQHGGQSIAQFDRDMAPGVRKTFSKRFRALLAQSLGLLSAKEVTEDEAATAVKAVEERLGRGPSLAGDAEVDSALAETLAAAGFAAETAAKAIAFARLHAARETDHATLQAMEALVHNLNTMHSRAGAQTPFSSINYGTDTSPEGRLVTRNLLLATERGLGRGETPIFPIQIFRVKDGVNYNPGDPNHDLFRLACRVSAKRLFPNFSFVDAPFNIAYYKPGRPETEVAYMGCRTRVLANVHDPEREVAPHRGNLSFTSINLPRLALVAQGNEKVFFDLLDKQIDLVHRQLLSRMEIQARRKVRNLPFLMGEGVWLDSEKLSPDDEIREVIKHGSLTTGFIGLAETLVALYGHHHGESEEMEEKGLAIVRHMRKRCDEQSARTKLNFTLIATPAEGLSGRFVRLDKKRFGIIPGVTDRAYYTNSFHVPVHFAISAAEKIRKEAPFHALTNGGHITYVELDGDMARNPKAFEGVIRAMHDAGIGYGSVNHPVDRDPACGYNGVIDGDTCPKCGRKEDEKHPFERIRRITGYLVGTLDRFNDAKRHEEHDRVRHRVKTPAPAEDMAPLAGFRENA
jgi:ribonucleoside-triphosphate reductase